MCHFRPRSSWLWSRWSCSNSCSWSSRKGGSSPGPTNGLWRRPCAAVGTRTGSPDVRPASPRSRHTQGPDRLLPPNLDADRGDQVMVDIANRHTAGSPPLPAPGRMTRHGPEESPVREHHRAPALTRHCYLTPADARAAPILNQHIKTVLRTPLETAVQQHGLFFRVWAAVCSSKLLASGRY